MLKISEKKIFFENLGYASRIPDTLVQNVAYPYPYFSKHCFRLYMISLPNHLFVLIQLRHFPVLHILGTIWLGPICHLTH